jgi:hypothetical protein
MTPLDEEVSVEAGEREVLARRVGYLETRERVHVEDGAIVNVDLSMERDPDASPDMLGTLALRLPDADAIVRIDGGEVALIRSQVSLPIGVHELSLEVSDRRPIHSTVEIRSHEVSIWQEDLVWTDSARRALMDRATVMRSVGWVLIAGGGLAALISGVLMAWNEPRIAEYEDIDWLYTQPGGCDPEGRDCMAEHGEETWDRYEELSTKALYGVRYGSIAGLGIGLLAAGAGLALVLLAPTEEEIDAEASADLELRVVPGPGSISLFGAF